MKTRIVLVVLSVVFLTCLVFGPSVSYAGERIKGCDLFACAVIGDGLYIAVSDRGKIFLSENYGKDWGIIVSDTKVAFTSVCFPDDKHGWITGQGGIVLHSTDGGRTWEMQSSGVNKYLLAVDFLDAENGCAVGADSTVVITSNGGKTWRLSPFDLASDLGEEFNLFTVKMLDASHICIAGDMGRIFISEDAGKTWKEADSPLYDEEMMVGRSLYSIAYDSGMLSAVGIDGTYVYSKDFGKSWTEGNSGINEPELFCIDIAGGIGLAAGSGGSIVRTMDGGVTWETLKTPERVWGAWLSGIDLKKNISGEINGLLVGQNGSVCVIRDSQLTWQ